MYIGRVPEVEILLHKALNLIESIKLQDCFVPKAKALSITKIEEALFWLNYEGRQAPPAK